MYRCFGAQKNCNHTKKKKHISTEGFTNHMMTGWWQAVGVWWRQYWHMITKIWNQTKIQYSLWGRGRYKLKTGFNVATTKFQCVLTNVYQTYSDDNID